MFKKQEGKSAGGEKVYKRKLPLMREKSDSFGRKHAIIAIPVIVVTQIRIDVPAIAGVPVHVNHAALVVGSFHSTARWILSGLYLTWGIEARQIRLPTDHSFLRSLEYTLQNRSNANPDSSNPEIPALKP